MTKRRDGTRRGNLAAASVALVGLLGALLGVVPASGVTRSRLHEGGSPPIAGTSCPWVDESLHHQATPAALANQVLSVMTLTQKADVVVLGSGTYLENINTGVPSLCIPPLTLTDGPNGVASGLSGVTQLPAAIGVAASFNPAIARATGQVLGAEARAKGISVAQGPELNLARIPEDGRIFETYGEDPFLTSVLGVANIEGIQSTGEMADVKHFTAYTQETARLRLNQVVSARALAELYNAPFKAAVEQAHVASLMCSYGSLNGVNTCSDPYLYATLRSWGFQGFVRSDLRAAPSMASAFRAGISLIKPGPVSALVRLVQNKSIPVRDLNRAVRSVLTEMFAYGLFAHPRFPLLSQYAASPSHANVALRAAEASVVLLKNSGSLLPLSTHVGSVVIIGVDAGPLAQVAGGGSSAVVAPFVITPRASLISALGKRVHVSYTSGGLSTLDVDQLSDVDLVSGTPLKLVAPIKVVGEAGKADVSVELSPNVTPATATATSPGTSAGWSRWSFKVRAHKTGVYEISLQDYGDTWLYVNGRAIMVSRGLHAPATMTSAVSLRGGRAYTFSSTWFHERHHPLPTFGIADVTPRINAAVRAARRAKVAIVFAGDFSTEGNDNPTLNLPGAENQLIAAVAKANRHTVVVLNSGNAVLMPWLKNVSSVVEAWFPGEEDGPAIAAVLTGAFDPSGRLPLTFPASPTRQPATSAKEFPGVDLSVNFGSGASALDIGYRWYQAHGVKPLFPFGFGLDYTTFKLARATLSRTPSGIALRLVVTNTGHRTGADIVQVYVKYPASAGEPPEQLRAFTRVDVRPSTSRHVSLHIPWSGFEIFKNGRFTTVPGDYGIDIGQSSSDLPLRLTTRLR